MINTQYGKNLFILSLCVIVFDDYKCIIMEYAWTIELHLVAVIDIHDKAHNILQFWSFVGEFIIIL